MSIKQIKSLVQFTRGNSLVWDALDTAIPDGVIVFSLDDGIFKLGNGLLTYQNLPTLFTFQGLVAAQGGSSGSFVDPTVEQNNEIVTVALVDGELKYSASGTTLASVLASITALEAENINQDSAIATLLATMLKIDVSIGTGDVSNLITIVGAKYADSGQSISSIIAAAEAANTTVPGPHLEEPIFYTTAKKEVVISKLALGDDSTVYCDVVGFHDSTDTPVFDLVTDNVDTTVVNVSGSLFSITFAGATTAGISRPVILTASVDDGTGNSKVEKAIACMVQSSSMLVSIYGANTTTDYFNGVTTDSLGNIIAVGVTDSEGQGTYECLIVKLDSNLNILARKVYGGTNIEYLHGVAVDSNDNIFCAGYTASEGQGLNDALVVKFDSNLNKLAAKIYGGINYDVFYDMIIDSNDNIICVGYTRSEGGLDEGLIVKYGNDLNKLTAKKYGGASYEIFYGVTIDSNGNIICAGFTTTEGAGSYAALVVKLDSNLNKIAAKIYGGSGSDQFRDIAVDSSDNIICIGISDSEGQGGYECLIVKLDSNLNKIAAKIYGGSGNTDYFRGIAVDSSDNIICAGVTDSEGQGGYECLMVKYDSNLNKIAAKIYGGSGADHLRGIIIDYNGNIICAGYTTTEGSGDYEALVVKFPSNLPSGTFVGTIISNLTMQDSNLTLADSNLTLADSNLTLADSNLTLADSTMTLADSNLTQVTDILG